LRLILGRQNISRALSKAKRLTIAKRKIGKRIKTMRYFVFSFNLRGVDCLDGVYEKTLLDAAAKFYSRYRFCNLKNVDFYGFAP
jgi:hypothetical protein